ncbi:MAG: esterase family protein [Gemmatimonadaceae bacterium]|jgi:pimeloyl-ACP methyl ester carboxylesterase|nr:esterase family protein [Gemmatimonadaceae bacterium]
MVRRRLRPRTLLLLAAVVGALYLAWSFANTRRGSQTVAFRPAQQACDSLGALRYCVYRSAAGTNGDVLYYLHARNLDETVWNDDTYLTGLLQAEWQRQPGPPPTVVAVSYGPIWLLAPKGRQPASGLLEDLMAKLPAIEARVGKPRRRLLMGESMGGLNVLVAGLSHPSAFAKVAALCPGVYASSPFASFAAMRADMVRTGADPKIVFGVWRLARQYVADEAEWRRFSPLHLVDRLGPQAPALYLSCGLYDAYGNFEGTSRLAAVAANRGLAVEWHPTYGGHCATDVVSLAAFLRS